MNLLKTHLIDSNQAPPTIPKPANALRILHTSDWHLGKLLYGQARYDEFAKFLDWLQDALLDYQVDVLIVAGDIFDTMTPSNRAEHLYHHFLATAFLHQIKHIVIVAGNHDSPTNLQKTKEVLGVLNTQVIGAIDDEPHEQLITLTDSDNQPIAIVMAVPYLRDRDVRTSGDATSIEQKNQLLLQGVADYYHSLANLAKQQQAQIRQTYQKTVPIIATGHLYAAGASVSSDDDGMRDIQVGTLGQINANIFDDVIDYVALGHIHAAQMVAKQNRIRYCGSPIAMGFGEIGRHKQVLLVDLPLDKKQIHSENLPQNPPQIIDNNTISDIAVHSLPVPIFHNLARIVGDMDFIKASIHQLKSYEQTIWLEIEYQADTLIANLKQQITDLLDNSQLVAVSIKNKGTYQGSLKAHTPTVNLEHLDEMEIFYKRLSKENLNNNEEKLLIDAYQTLLKQMQETDANAQ
ncbi:exonuclease SbcCD subunit D C-terminal domain-containing protein [Moraxella marmotae]|uniref:exonuclease SbcCD subunit D C-terminal domain-containing protein n=1 Tax=Moraxella marmotae TaxID=3344520 RepID=UPI0035F2B352